MIIWTLTAKSTVNNLTISDDAEVVPDKKQDIKKDEKDKTPAKTGDNTQLVVFAALFLVSGIYLLMRMKKS